MTIDTDHATSWADMQSLEIVGATPHQGRWAINARTDTGGLVRIILTPDEARTMGRLLVLKQPPRRPRK